LRQGTDMFLLEQADPATKAYPSATESNTFSSDSVSSLYSQSLPPSSRILYGQKGKEIDLAEIGGTQSSVRDNGTFLEHPLQLSTSRGSSPLLGIDELVPGSQWRTPSMNNRISVSTSFTIACCVRQSATRISKTHGSSLFTG
jgi:hypothetical protein